MGRLLETMKTSPRPGFEIGHMDRSCAARSGVLHTVHGPVRTPVFMPVGTQATVKGMTPEELASMRVEIILCNTYHLHLRPGAPVIRDLGGLHVFMNWPGPILTDSGGFQVFSLSPLRRITEEGVRFRSHLDGSECFFSPESAVAVQEALATDIAMCLDECIPHPAARTYAEQSTARTGRWAKRCKDARRAAGMDLFGIVQGGMYGDLRRRSAQELVEIGFEGYAIGGLSVGESLEARREMVETVLEVLPVDRPRYLMGVGAPEDLVMFIPLGVDMFDCVIPTRCARNGLLFTRTGRLDIRHAAHKASEKPIDETCGCYTCLHYSRAYLRHLYMAKEILAARLNTLHNLYYFMGLIAEIRQAIQEDRLRALREAFFRSRDKEGWIA
jgi:queuine tRNA-ribosyltransferase